MDKYILDGEYLLVAEDGENLRTQQTPIAFLARGRFWVNNHAHVLRANERADTRFLMYALRGAGVHAYLTGSTMPKLTQANLHRVPVVAPPLDIQRAVANVLGALDDKIDLNGRLNGTLRSTVQAIFKSWCVDFDSPWANTQKRPQVVDVETTELLPHCFYNSPLGKVPTGCRLGSLLEVALLLSGGTPRTSRPEYWDGPIPWASAKDISQCRDPFLVSTERTITQRGLDESPTQLIPRFSTVIVARGATTGRMAMLGDDMAMNQTCYALQPKAQTPFFLFELLRHSMPTLVHAAHGSVFDTITTSTFERSSVILPPEPVRRAFETMVAPLYERILLGQRESVTLAEMRDALLPKLLSGEIRVFDAECSVARHV